jgi:hypothetical protein
MKNSLHELEKQEIREHLIKCWMTHDAMWFYHCLQAFGIEKTNTVNLAAVRSMATVEIRRVMKLIGMEKKQIHTFRELLAVVEGAFAVGKADFMLFDYAVPKENVLQWNMRQCFAHDGIAQIGAIGEYQCGILERIKGWFDGMGVSYTTVPEIKGCLMHTQGSCTGEFRTDLQ